MSSRSKTSYSVNLEQSLEPAPEVNQDGTFELGIALSACNVQLPVTESKNSLFIELSSLQFSMVDQTMNAEF